MSAERCCRHARAATLLALVAAGPVASAQGTQWALCGDGLVLPQRPPVDIQREPGEPEGTVHISADRADLNEIGQSTLIDNVQLVRGNEQVQAQRVTYDKGAEVLDAAGGVRLWKDGMHAAGTTAHLDLAADVSSLNDASYLMLEEHAHGEASQIELEGETLVRVKDATYTTCNPGEVAWMLEADLIRLDRVEEVGFARNVLVRFHDVPIFYSPVMTFPIGSARKSGFLAPSFGVTGSTGVELTVPYYFNLAPNRDATVAARAMSERGVMLQGEYRYLTTWGQGLLGGEFMANDSKRDEARGALHFEHTGEFAPRWKADVDASWVSDSEYFEDIGTDLSIASTRFVERRADLRYAGDGWSMLGRLQNFQTVDNTLIGTNRPYERLPQLLFNTSSRNVNREFNLNLSAEFVHFERSAGVTGQRVNLVPSVTFPVRTASSFLVPKLSLHHTAYALRDNTTRDNSPTRTLPTFSTDAGMFFDRDLQLGQRAFVQTLEPRAFYLYVPFERQDDLPVFDTGRYSFNFSQLFREDRFSGPDRMGDANQLSLALTSRLLDAGTGDEVFRASIGQIRYFRDRRVTLPERVTETDGSSDLVADVAAQVADAWRVGAGLQWNLGSGTTNKSAVSVRWQPDRRHIVNASYRFVREASEQTDFSFRWPLGTHWSTVGRWNYAPADDRTLEVFGGFEYESCCWALRAVGRRYLSNSAGGYNNGVFVQLELKGLADVATGASEFLERSIPGYRPGY